MSSAVCVLVSLKFFASGTAIAAGEKFQANVKNPSMKHPLFFVFSFLFFQNMEAQIGVSGGYRSFLNEGWNDELLADFGDDFATMEGWSFAVDYWFRLKKRRVEFTPELAFGKFEKSPNYIREHQFISFHFNTNLYIFDLAEDCDCPTWSKDGGIMKKGFHIQISPGVSRMRNKFYGALENSNVTKYYPEIGIGAGLDIGISDFFTITPLAKFFFSPNAEWEGINLPDGIRQTTLSGTSRQFFAGLRLGFRFDRIRRF